MKSSEELKNVLKKFEKMTLSEQKVLLFDSKNNSFAIVKKD
jgi:hypothetical protein